MGDNKDISFEEYFSALLDELDTETKDKARQLFAHLLSVFSSNPEALTRLVRARAGKKVRAQDLFTYFLQAWTDLPMSPICNTSQSDPSDFQELNPYVDDRTGLLYWKPVGFENEESELPSNESPTLNASPTPQTSPVVQQPGPSSGRAPLGYKPTPHIFPNTDSETEDDIDDSLLKPKRIIKAKSKKIATKSNEKDDDKKNDDNCDDSGSKSGSDMSIKPKRIIKPVQKLAKKQDNISKEIKRSSSSSSGDDDDAKPSAAPKLSSHLTTKSDSKKLVEGIAPTFDMRNRNVNILPNRLGELPSNDDDTEGFCLRAIRLSKSNRRKKFKSVNDAGNELLPIRVIRGAKKEKIASQQQRCRGRKRTKGKQVDPKVKRRPVKECKLQKLPIPEEDRVKCEECPRTFTTKGNMNRHFREKHLSLEDFPCPVCGINFTMERNRQEHYNAMHRDNPHFYTCPFCGIRYVRRQTLNKHIRDHHPV